MTAKLSNAIQNRLDAITNTDPAASAALGALYNVFTTLDNRQYRELHTALTGAFLDALQAVQAACWLDGLQCGRDPDRLVFSDGTLRHPDPGVEL